MWRDAGDWERFRGVWHDDGRMMATWFQGPADEFIQVSRAGFERGVRILHFLGGSSVDVAGDRAVAQTKMTITQRAPVHGVECDVVCTGRFYDFFERRDGRWGDRAAPADLRAGPAEPGRPGSGAEARPRGARALPGRLPPPRLPAGAAGLHRQAGHARPRRARRWRRCTRAAAAGWRARLWTGSRWARAGWNPAPTRPPGSPWFRRGQPGNTPAGIAVVVGASPGTRPPRSPCFVGASPGYQSARIRHGFVGAAFQAARRPPGARS